MHNLIKRLEALEAETRQRNMDAHRENKKPVITRSQIELDMLRLVLSMAREAQDEIIVALNEEIAADQKRLKRDPQDHYFAGSVAALVQVKFYLRGEDTNE